MRRRWSFLEKRPSAVAVFSVPRAIDGGKPIMRKRGILGGLLAVLMLSALFAASAGATPAWKFNGKALEGTETILGGAEKSGLTMWGFTTTCDNFLYEVDIKNEAGTGKGSVTS